MRYRVDQVGCRPSLVLWEKNRKRRAGKKRKEGARRWWKWMLEHWKRLLG